MEAIRILGMSLLVMVFSVQSFAQTSIDTYFEKYREDDRFSKVSVSSRMFELFVDLEMDDPESQEMIETISKLKGLKVLIGEEVQESKTLYQEVLKNPAAGMDELMSVSDAEKEIRFFIKETNGKISEILMAGYDNSQLIVMNLTGEIDLKQLAKLSKKMNVEGFEHFKNLNK